MNFRTFVRKRRFALGLLVAAVSLASLIAAFVSNGDRRPPLQKGTWIWDAASVVEQAEDILHFSKRNGVTHIYLYVDRENVSPGEYARFIAQAGKQGIRVEALAGDPSWGWREKREHLQSFLEWVARYNTDVDEEARFSGIHLDIEPYLLPEWETDAPRLLEEWLANLDYAAREARRIGGLEASVDVPFWIHEIEVPGYERFSVGAWMFKRFDTVVLMDYRDRAEGSDGIVAHASAMVDEATSADKAVVVGVEVAPNDEAEKTTFHEEGIETMERELEKTRRHFQNYRGFRGTAVHGFPEWMSRERKGE
ncbi:copper amine oxidase N-terminal domain-containing protein [Paenibacillus antri]|uniref:Copper amine oxidase N-terminal domain-containing protein n=1 Tax=Paenibacillus antri TaxID=2582848 RepID=A0A5R9G8F0_9BACL|nr:copper amine oxidase N-terminal domain-containing protein [Paenibacillus antri]TLS52672.1 copper amine oxidase N-terminal domain-containing protein [Paenibacillus antri]